METEQERRLSEQGACVVPPGAAVANTSAWLTLGERGTGGGLDGPYGLLSAIIMPAEGGILEPIGSPIRELDDICKE